VDYSKPANLILTAVVLIVGLSGTAVNIGEVELKGMALGTVVGMIMSFIFHMLESMGLTNQAPEQPADL
jgi:uracil permease